MSHLSRSVPASDRAVPSHRAAVLRAVERLPGVGLFRGICFVLFCFFKPPLTNMIFFSVGGRGLLCSVG